MSKAVKKQGEAAFEEYYASQFGERWPTLREALFSEPLYAEMKVTSACSENSETAIKPYFMDIASVFAGYAIPLPEEGEILDMCAAPGGKTLVVASRMSEKCHLTSNERSRDRFQRLNKVVEESVPESIRRNISTTCFDGATMCNFGREKYESILLDAPCSSERHVIQDQKYLALWTKSRVKTIYMTQWSLLSSAVLLLKPEGHILYSTCALTREENDDVIKKALKKYENLDIQRINVNEIRENLSLHFPGVSSIPGVEETEYGYHILPDRQKGAGPIYLSIIVKKY